MKPYCCPTCVFYVVVEMFWNARGMLVYCKTANFIMNADLVNAHDLRSLTFDKFLYTDDFVNKKRRRTTHRKKKKKNKNRLESKITKRKESTIYFISFVAVHFMLCIMPNTWRFISLLCGIKHIVCVFYCRLLLLLLLFCAVLFLC